MSNLISSFSRAAGAIFNELDTESCVYIGGEWVMGTAHSEKKLSNVIDKVLCFDLDLNLDEEFINKRKFFSIDPTIFDIENNEFRIKIFHSLEIDLAFFKIRPSIEGELPCDIGVNPPDLQLSMSKGDEIYAVGYPGETWVRKLVKGVIKNIDNIEDFVEADLSGINSGFSGGPVFNEKGELLGVLVNMKHSDNGFDKFIPIKKIVKNFRKNGFDFDKLNIFKDV